MHHHRHQQPRRPTAGSSSLSMPSFYDERNPLLKGNMSSVDRDRLREQERQARVAMSVYAEHASTHGIDDPRLSCNRDKRMAQQMAQQGRRVGPEPDTGSLFRAPVKVTPDAQTEQIASKMGEFSMVKEMLLVDTRRLIGIEAVPASPAPSTNSRGARSSPSQQKFKKPGSSARGSSSSSSSGPPQPQPPPASSSASSSATSSSTSSSYRNGFAKPADGKTAQQQGSRPGYPGQPSAKHTEHRSHVLIPLKGPQQAPAGSGPAPQQQSRTHNPSVRLPKLPIDTGSSSNSNSRPHGANITSEVETILKEMTMPPTPLTAIAQTPRKELESKFTFNPALEKLTEVAAHQETQSKQRERHTTHRLSADLERDLSLSEDSDEDDTPALPNIGAPLMPTLSAAPLPPVPMSPMAMSPIGPIMSPETRAPAPAPQSQLPQQQQPPPQSQQQQQQQQQQSAPQSQPTPTQQSRSPPHKTQPSPAVNEGGGGASSGSASSSSDSGSDSGSDSSDDSDEETSVSVSAPSAPTAGAAAATATAMAVATAPTTAGLTPKGPTTPASVSGGEPAEEPQPPVPEESKPRWNLSSFFNKAEQTDKGKKEESRPEPQPARRSSRHSELKDWQLLSSESEQQSDIDKLHTKDSPRLQAQTEKPKPPDVRKRGRPRKTDKSPGAAGPAATSASAPAPAATAEEPSTKPRAKRNRQRTSTSSPTTRPSGGGARAPKKQPISKAVLSSATSDDASDSDSEPHSRRQASPPQSKRHHRLSVSSSDDDDDDDDDDDEEEEREDDEEDEDEVEKRRRGKRSSDDWARHSSAIKRSAKIGEKKIGEKKKSAAKLKPRRQRSRMNRSECPSGSDTAGSEVIPRNNRKVARVQPTLRIPPTRTSSPDNSDSDNSPASVKLQEETGGAVEDNKKSALRRLFVDSRAKGGKGGKGGKAGAGKCGIYVEEYTSNTPTGSESPYKRPSSVAPDKAAEETSTTTKRPPTVSVPPVTYHNGAPSIMCRLELNRLGPIVPQPSRGQQIRQRTEMPDTRPTSARQSGTSSQSQSQRPSTPEEGEIVESAAVGDDSDSGCLPPKPSNSRLVDRIKTEPMDCKPCEAKPVASDASAHNSASASAAGANQANSCHELMPIGRSAKRKRKESGSSVSSLASSVDTKIKSEMKLEKKKKRKHQDIVERFSSSQQIDVQPTNHEREEKPDMSLIPPPPERVFYSYFYVQNQPEDLDRYQEQYLAEAKRLKHKADEETDVTTQGLLYLEGAIYFILTGQAMESSRVSCGAAYRMYKDTYSIIKFISKKFQVQQNDSLESSIHQKLLILSLWCQSLICQKLYDMRKSEVKDNHQFLSKYFAKQVILQPEGQGTPSLSPTPSPAGSVGSVGSQSSGYSSGELANRGMVNGQAPVPSCVSVPLSVHTSMQKQNEDMDLLMSSHDKWEKAAQLVTDKHRDFFIQLDETMGPLTPRSSFTDLGRYVQAGIKKLRAL